VSWLRIREATRKDWARLDLAAVVFIKVHRLESYTQYATQAADPCYSASFALERTLNRWSDLFRTHPALHEELTELWRAEAARALREEDASGIIDGYVVGRRKP
jgi:hypothetical protein